VFCDLFEIWRLRFGILNLVKPAYTCQKTFAQVLKNFILSVSLNDHYQRTLIRFPELQKSWERIFTRPQNVKGEKDGRSN
jgi:hypothetical protein